MTDVRERYLDAWRVVVDLADRVPSQRWDAGTPCERWNSRQLVGHLVDGAGQVQAMLGGRDVPAPVGDPLQLARLAGPDPAAALRGAAHAVAAALAELDDEVTVCTPRGALPLPQVLGMAMIEPVGHGWDLAVASGQRVRFAEEAVAGLLTGVQRLGGQLAASGMYAPATVSPATALPLDRLASALGRTVS